MFNKIYENVKNYIMDNYKFLIVLIVIVFLFYYEFPYIIYKRGGIIKLEDRIIINKEYKEDGSISMSYVNAVKGTAPFIILSYLIPDWDLVPLKDITDDKNFGEVLKRGKVSLNEGIDNAIIASFRESDYDITINKRIYHVVFIEDKAISDVEYGDELVSINDQEFTSIGDIRTYINTLNEGDKVVLKVINNKKEYQRFATIYRDEYDTLKMGIFFKPTYEYTTEIPVSIKTRGKESGSSGGLMMSLAIYNALTEEDITKGLNIVGTGTISSDGIVGEIDCVKYKVLAAVKNKADIFFCPYENYEEAQEIKNKRNLDIEIVKVNTLKEAIEYLENYSN